MAALDSGPCISWVPLCANWPAGVTPAITGAAVDAATELLWERTQRRFGECQVTLRPCKEECWPANAIAWLGSWLPTYGSGSWGWPYPALLGGRWFNLGCGSCAGSCSCTSVEQVRLPQPVASILKVKVDGVILNPTAYRVDDWQWLVRVDGGRWPTCNNLNVDDTHVDTWSVTASYGEVPPTLGQLACGELASQIAKMCVDGACASPAAALSQIQRQGVTKNYLQNNRESPGVSIGLVLCDRFIRTYNPTGSKPAAIFNMDGGRARRTGT